MSLARVAVLAALLAALAGATSAYAIPGPHRMVAPGLFGLVEIAPRIYTDDPERAVALLDLVHRAAAPVEAFFGELEARPRLVLCTRSDCDRAFGGNGVRSVAFGWHAIQVAPKAFANADLAVALIAHERVHAELDVRAGWPGLVRPRFPKWFDEGLATYLSRDPRIDLSPAACDAAGLRRLRTGSEWNAFVVDRGWEAGYGGSARLVAALDAKGDGSALRSLIARTLAGEDFDHALAAEAAGLRCYFLMK